MLPLTNNVMQSDTEHFIVPENEPVVAATNVIKRGRRPLSDEVNPCTTETFGPLLSLFSSHSYPCFQGP